MVSRAGLLLPQQRQSSSRSEAEKFVDYRQLVKFTFESKQNVEFWIDVVSKKIDFDTFSKMLTEEILHIRMSNDKPTLDGVSRESLFAFFSGL